MNKIDKQIAIWAIGCLTVLQIFAMHYGINGTMRTITFTIIAALAGLTIDTSALLKGGK